VKKEGKKINKFKGSKLNFTSFIAIIYIVIEKI
jgi:hypothetical protein